MNHQNIVNLKDGPASVIYSLAIMAIVFQESICAMETTIAWIIAMKMNVINAITANVTKKLNSLVMRINRGADLNAFPRNGLFNRIVI